MKSNQRRKLDKFEREIAFMTDNAADFPAASPGKTTADALAAVITQIKQLVAQQISGADDRNMGFDNKQDAFNSLTELLQTINRAANAMEDEIPNINSKFRLPRNRSQQNVLATARSFQADAVPYKTNFIAYDLSPDFLDDLQELIDAVESSDAVANSAGTSLSEATGALVELIRRAMTLSKKLDAVVRNKYRTNAGKLAAWTVASHLERAPQAKKKQNPNPA